MQRPWQKAGEERSARMLKPPDVLELLPYGLLRDDEPTRMPACPTRITHSIVVKIAGMLRIFRNQAAQYRTLPWSTIVVALAQPIAIFVGHAVIPALPYPRFKQILTQSLPWANSISRRIVNFPLRRKNITDAGAMMTYVCSPGDKVEALTMDTVVYGLGGLRIASDFPLFGLQVCQSETAAHCEVAIQCAPIP